MPDDPEFENMDPIMKIYLFNHWLEDQNEQVEFYKHHGYLIGSFINPEAVQKLTNPSNIAISDDDFEKSSQMVREARQREEVEKPKTRKRKRKKAN